MRKFLFLTVCAFFSVSKLFAITVGEVEFSPTHIWTGNAGTTDFHTQGNWCDIDGQSVSSAPDSSAIVYIPSPETGTRSIDVTKEFSIHSLYVGSGTTAGKVMMVFKHCKNNNVSKDVHLFDGATLTAADTPNGIKTFANEVNSYKVNIVAGGNITIDAQASVDVTGKGFLTQCPSGSAGSNRNGGPGSFAGVSLAVRNGEVEGGKNVYGSVYFPTNLGAATAFNLGGGATYIHADGNFKLNGSVFADAKKGGYGDEMQGSGGSVLIECATLSGSGTISASTISSLNHAAGGGRIAVHQSVATDMAGFEGLIKAYSVKSGKMYAGAGTIYLRFAGQELGDGELIIDNDSVACNTLQVTELAENDVEFGKVTVKRGGRLHLRAGQTLRVRRGIDTTGGSIYCEANSVVDCSYPNEILFSGKSKFANFICTNDLAELRFASGAENSFGSIEDGFLKITGSEQRKIRLVSYPDEEQWYMNLAINTKVDISHVAISGCDASGGASGTITAILSEDLGGNVGWVFSLPILPGDPIIWTGAEDSSWMNDGNWNDKYSKNRIPVSTDMVQIPAGCANYPEIPANAFLELASISIDGSITVGDAAKVIVAGDIVSTGHIALGDKTVLECEGDISMMPGSSFTGDASQVKVVGTGNQTVNLAAQSYNKVTISKSAGTVAMPESFSCKFFDIRATGDVSVSFSGSKTYCADVFLVSGYVNGNAALSLGPVSQGDKWKFIVKEKGLVTSTIVSSCDSSGGVAVVADNRSTIDGCVNWVSLDRVHIWNGPSAGGSVATAGNWLPADGLISGSRAIVVADGAMSLTSTSSLTLESLDIYPCGNSVGFDSSATLHLNSDFEARSKVSMTLSKPVTVGGDVIFRTGSSLTHKIHGTNDRSKLYAVDISSEGDVTIEAGVSVNVVGKGFAKQKGPGYGGGNAGPIPPHGGRYRGFGTDKNCYGSILAPVTLGSGGYSGPGGGAVKIAAQGIITLESDIKADSPSYNYANSAGSVYLKCAKLKGSGSVSATAGDYTSIYGGCGGRVAVVQTEETDFSAWTGTAKARGSYYSNYSSQKLGGSGTVYLKSAGSPGKVIVENWKYFSPAETQIPISDDGNAATAYKDVDFVIPSNMTISLLGDVTIHDLDLQSSTSKLRLNGHTLMIVSGTHRNGRRWGDTYANLVTEDGGEIVWLYRPGLKITVR